MVLVIALLLYKGVTLQFTNRKEIVYGLLLGTLGCSIYYLFLYYGYAAGNSIEVLLIQYSWPIQMVLLANIILKEPLSLIRFFAVITGFIGIILIITKGKLVDVQFSGIEVSITVLAGAFCFALFSVLGKRSNMEVFHFVVVLFLGGTISTVIALLLFSEFKLPSRSEIFPVFINGVFINGLSYLLWIFALRKISATSAGVMIFFTPVLSTTWLVIFFDEVLYSSYVLGGVIVILSGMYLLRKV